MLAPGRERGRAESGPGSRGGRRESLPGARGTKQRQKKQQQAHFWCRCFLVLAFASAALCCTKHRDGRVSAPLRPSPARENRERGGARAAGRRGERGLSSASSLFTCFQCSQTLLSSLCSPLLPPRARHCIPWKPPFHSPGQRAPWRKTSRAWWRGRPRRRPESGGEKEEKRKEHSSVVVVRERARSKEGKIRCFPFPPFLRDRSPSIKDQLPSGPG